MKEGAFNMIQSTKPQTLAYQLNDSPAGLAAWMIGMIKTGADGDKVDEAFGSRDELLTNIMIYWVTQTAGSAAHMYAEEAKATYGAKPSGPQKSEVPAAIALFQREAQAPREWAERSLNVQRFTKMPRGGHFAALEEPEMYAQDLRESFREIPPSNIQILNNDFVFLRQNDMRMIPLPGLAAWLVEKSQRLSDCDGDVEKRFTKDGLLTNIRIYWAPKTIGSSFRPYYDVTNAGALS